MKLKIGDTFAMYIDESVTGFGQIVDFPNKDYFIVIVFEKIYKGKKWPNLSKVFNDNILLLGYTVDSLLYHKKWTVIGNNITNISNIKLPYHKLDSPPNAKIVNYKGDIIRKASKEEFNTLDYETVVAPIRFNFALKGYHKLGEWDEDYDRLLYEKTLESIKIVEG
jgi:hypothetical protein